MHISFIINRLRRMSPEEIFFRIRQKFFTACEKTSFRNIKFNFSIIKDAVPLLSCLPDADPSFAKEICDGNLKTDLFKLKDVNLNENINYNKDYLSGSIISTNIFGKDIDYRNSNKVGDIKYLWELNRQFFLLNLALSYKYYNNAVYLSMFEILLKEWFYQNPFLMGANWSSPLETGIRLINWTFCWHLVRDAISDSIKEQWVQSIYQHCWFIQRNFSRYSSANNHLIGEAAGLFIASTALPQFRDSEKWQAAAYKILADECEKQNCSDGVNREQATSYQQFVLDLLLISGLVGKACGISFPETYWRRLEKMMEFIAAMEDCEGNLPQFGDDDDGMVIDLGQGKFGNYRSLLNTGGFLFNRKDFLKEGCGIDYKTKFLLKLAGIEAEHLPVNEKNIPVRFDQGGYYILGCSLGERDEQRLIFDCGPLGYLSIAAHGHSDALSFYFSAGGCPIFVDPGTYAYHTNKSWRNYFRSTMAHNTVCVDNKDQSNMCGNFMWGRKAKACLLYHEEGYRVKGYHDGYFALSDKVKHTREIIFDKSKNKWDIIDELTCRGDHTIDLYFHLHPDCTLLKENNRIDIYFKKGKCILELNETLDVSVYNSDENLRLGWYSGLYDIKVPTDTVRASGKICGNSIIVTSFQIKFSN